VFIKNNTFKKSSLGKALEKTGAQKKKSLRYSVKYRLPQCMRKECRSRKVHRKEFETTAYTNIKLGIVWIPTSHNSWSMRQKSQKTASVMVQNYPGVKAALVPPNNA
jgi:hypothetical protein